MSVQQDTVANPMQKSPNERANLAKAVQANMTLILQVIGLGAALWAPLIAIMFWMSGNFTDIRTDISDMEKRLTAQIQELDDRLSARIQELDDRIDGVDNKLIAIGDMTVIAYTDGEITGDELAAIWQRANATQ